MPMKSAPRGTKIYTPEPAPTRGEPAMNMNKAAPSKMAGGPRDLSRTLSGASVPGGESPAEQ